MDLRTIASLVDPEALYHYGSSQEAEHCNFTQKSRAVSAGSEFVWSGIKKLQHRVMAFVQPGVRRMENARMRCRSEEFFMNKIIAKVFGHRVGVPARFEGGLASPYMRLERIYRSEKIDLEAVKKIKQEIETFVGKEGKKMAKNLLAGRIRFSVK